MKSMCQVARRNSPSVTDRNPTSSCMRTASSIAASSAALRPSSSSLPAACASRASCSSGGRSRLPTWSARYGGLVRSDIEPPGPLVCGMRTMAHTAHTIVSLGTAVSELVRDGDTVALEGFTHLIPMAAGQELIRQRRRDLTLVRMTPDIVYDQLIGAGCARKLVFSWGGNPGVGSLHRFRDAIQNGWPQPLEIEEHSHAGLANRYVVAASGLPCAGMRGYRGTALPEHTSNIKPITCPFTGEELTAVPALELDVAIVHAQRADRDGNVQMRGLTGVQKEAVLAAKRSLVTVEEIVDELEPVPNAVVLPKWVVTHVAETPHGAHPSYTHDYYERDNAYYREWDGISKEREGFEAWLAEEVLST